MSPQPLYRHYAPLKRPPHRSGNPYFRSRSADRVSISRVKTTAARLPFKFWAYLFAIIFLIVAASWALFFSPLFIIDQVTVTGTDDIRARQIEEMFWQASDTSRFYVLSQAHLPLFNSESLKLEILNRYNLETVEIQKKIPKTISITIKEKVPAVVWFEADIYYILDSFGYILNIATGPVTDLPIIYNNNQVKINESGKQIMNQEAVIKMASELKPQLINALSYLKVNQMTVTHEQNTLTLVLKDGPLIYLATNEALGTQLERLTTLLRTDLKNRLNKLTYIDLRFGDKIYYK
jgi:cell division septal protein FtsQ